MSAKYERPPVILDQEELKMSEVQKALKKYLDSRTLDEPTRERLAAWYRRELKGMADRKRRLGEKITPEFLSSAVSSVLGELKARVEQLSASKERGEERLNPSLLTKSGMRKKFESSLEKMRSNEIRRSDKRVVMVLVNIDLDDFKMINDNYDHIMGDEVLRRTGDALDFAVRPGDACAHYSGDEFGFMMELELDEKLSVEQVKEKIKEIVARVINNLQKKKFTKRIGKGDGSDGIRPDGREQELSVGYRVVYPRESGSFEDFSKDADKASELSKIMRLIKENRHQTVVSSERAVCFDDIEKQESEFPVEEREDARVIRDMKRSLQERYPNIPRSKLFEMIREDMKKYADINEQYKK